MIEKITAILFPPANKPTPLPFISDEHMDNNLRNQVYIVQQQLDNNQDLLKKMNGLVDRMEKHGIKNSMLFNVVNVSILVISFFFTGFIVGKMDISKSIHPSSEIIKNSQMEATPCEKI